MLENITSPEDFFGFKMGSDRKIARWNKIVEYFKLLEDQSDKIKVFDLGPSTEGNPFILVIISSIGNLSNLDRIREDNLKLNNPLKTSETELEKILSRGKTIICQSMSLHATEIGGTQMASELAYDLITRIDYEAQTILENVVFLMIPCFNPDGQIMVTDWYNRYLGSEYEGCNPPWLYHKYAGHDNNRDAFQNNLVESKYMSSILFREWIPQVYVDHHHMGSYSCRLFVPPYCEPIHPHADPLIWREHSWYGSHMAYSLEEAGKKGVWSSAQYTSWNHLGHYRISNYHNIAGMHTESANSKLATPIHIHPNQLKGDTRGMVPSYKAQTNFPNPWPGGWWRLRDIVEQQKISAWSVLDLSAKHRRRVLRNAYLKAKRQTERGKYDRPKVYVVTDDQHDHLTALKLIDKLLILGVEIKVALEDFKDGRITYTKGSHIIFTSQPKRGVVKTLLSRTLYPDNPWTRNRDGIPLRPQDTTTDTIGEFMGVKIHPVENYPTRTEEINEVTYPEGYVLRESKHGYILDCRLNNSYIAINRLIASGAKIYRSYHEIETLNITLPSGSFIIQEAEIESLRKIAKELHLLFYPSPKQIEEKQETKRLRVGIYQRYWGGNPDEGWTRFLLEQFEFPYKSLNDETIKKGGLRQSFDAIIIPNDPTPIITGKGIDKWYEKNGRETPIYPPNYISGIGVKGVESLKMFVEKGGRLITLNKSCDFAVDLFRLKIRNVLDNLPLNEFFCPGSTLRAHVDVNHPLGYGMPKQSILLFWDSPAFVFIPSSENQLYEVVVCYPQSEVLQSGWLIGGEKLGQKAAMIKTRIGEGSVVLIGFRVQHRAQTHGTFKLLFNCLLS